MEKRTNIKINGAGKRKILLDLYYLKSKMPKPVIVFAHGFKGFKDWGPWDLIADYFTRKGYIFIKFNFSHNGTTPDDPASFDDPEAFGNNNFSLELEDLKRVIDWTVETTLIESEEIRKDDFCLIGHSRGGSIVLLQGDRDERVKKIITWSAVSDLGDYLNKFNLAEWEKEGKVLIKNARTGQEMPLYFQLYEDFRNNRKDYDLPSIIPKLNKPVLVVHGTEDEAVHFREALNIKKWNSGIKLELIPNGGHTFGGKHPWNTAVLPSDLKLVADLSAFFLEQN